MKFIQLESNSHLNQQAVLKFTEPDHPDYNSLVNAVKVVKDINDEINESKRAAEGRDKMFLIQKNMNNKPADLVRYILLLIQSNGATLT